MFKVFDTHGGNGWTTFQRCNNSNKLKKIINGNIGRIPKKVNLLHEHIHVKVEKEDTIIRFHFLKICDKKQEEHFEIEEYKYSVWKFKRHTIWKRESSQSEDFENEIFMKQDIKFYKKAESIQTLFDKGNFCNIGNENSYGAYMRESNYLGFLKTLLVLIKVRKRATCVEFLAEKKQYHVLPNRIPRAVNICYTGTIFGTICLHDQKSIIYELGMQKKGPCGSEFHIDTSMGVVQIFGNNSGHRRITCKAFVGIQQADFVINYICRMLNIEHGPPLVMHMLVLHGNTGCKMDISQNGYVVTCVNKFFPEAEYVAPIEEHNIHAIFRWNDIMLVYKHCPCMTIPVDTDQFMKHTELTLSVTRLGTCIYRIGTKLKGNKENATVENVKYDEETETFIIDICKYLHTFITSW